MTDVFVIAEASDATRASAAVDGLESAGLSCWLPARDLTPGVPAPAALMRAIKQSRACLVVLSAAHTVSATTLRQVAIAQSLGLVVVPANTEDAELPRALADVLGGVKPARLGGTDAGQSECSEIVAALAAQGVSPAMTQADGSPTAGWLEDPEVPDFLRFFDGSQWTHFQSPRSQRFSTGTVLAPPGIAWLNGWRFIPSEHGLTYWDGRNHTAFIELPRSVRDVSEDTDRELLQECELRRLLEERRAKMLVLDESIRYWAINLAATTAALERIASLIDGPPSRRLWEGSSRMMRDSNLSKIDGSGSRWGLRLPQSRTNIARALLSASTDDQPALDEGDLVIDPDRITFTGQGLTWSCSAEEASGAEVNVLRGELVVRLAGGGAEVRFCGLAPDAVALGAIVCLRECWVVAGIGRNVPDDAAVAFLQSVANVFGPSSDSVALLREALAAYESAMPQAFLSHNQ